MNMDNLQTNGSTIIPIYDIDVRGEDLYRLQARAMYFGGDYTWSTYNYQISPIRPFIDFVTIGAEAKILPATGRNTIRIIATVTDQYGQGVLRKPVYFEDTDPVGYIVQPDAFTDMDRGTGHAYSAYTAGIDPGDVTITVTAYQTD